MTTKVDLKRQKVAVGISKASGSAPLKESLRRKVQISDDEVETDSDMKEQSENDHSEPSVESDNESDSTSGSDSLRSDQEISEDSDDQPQTDYSTQSDNDDSDDEEIPTLPGKKKNKSDGSESFSKAINALLDSKLKAHNRKDPILARSKSQLKKLESEKLELKAKRQLLAEKKAKLTSNRVKNLLPTDDSLARQTLEREKRYRKVAQRGVIKLFNAILATQTETSKEIDSIKGVGQTKKKELVNEMSKEKFLDLVQEAGKS
ncbi:hypothetical protein KL905_004452 [Ogataea polymorpha]|uniref:Uncharacterized protein n=1 Tax=Ogataea polymorpha TaxID=460523 RepID=A0A1B7SBP0_9ASCO|nr:uncharacterized protein OGAPODRAFT_17516 [Ogataea polymorpha]KAG7877978.1 hypothetical protein KL937_004125 [Ogataea polymorpha]KAG7887208.1 hypothetical protein KL936_004368 [Ogataea polymorpha]KAG7896596.1 hypothetical protein KL908_001110 [Ogataea polymorpha]KAG7898373.1 hypothetical protein KL935_004523 [Ogataea polymorpha]KAG7900931.1 hypothetical protein KL907_004375 [Ogataea polymorpha]